MSTATSHEPESPGIPGACIRTYSLGEVAAMVLPREWKCPERWLRERLNRGAIPGYKVGAVWRMTQDDVDTLVVRYRNTDAGKPATPRPLSFTSRRRRSA